jgi:UDP-glucose 4-epimerase
VVEHLERHGYEVAGFDLADGSDLLDLGAVTDAAEAADAIVHMGAIAHDSAGSPDRIMAVNVLGTWHVLLAAEAAGIGKVIHFSSVQALGIAEGERLPDYFPVDDDHPRRAMHPYGLSKCLSEDLCEAVTRRTGIATLSLRPVWVWGPEHYRSVQEQWRADPESEWKPFWGYGWFVDIRDVADAVEKALKTELSGHHRTLLCAADLAGSAPSLELAARLAPAVPIRDPARYAEDPWRALFDCSAAESLFGWRPAHRWSERERHTGRA